MGQTKMEGSMGKKNDRIVYRRPDGKWVNEKLGADRASSIHGTQGDAADRAHEQLEASGGGELIIKGRDGKIKSKDTILPAKDPFPPRDTEH
jgi:hypothetical protein